MKLLLILTAIATILISASECTPANKNRPLTKYKGRLEIKGICSNYTISLLEGNIDTSIIAGDWTDETTRKSYKNVFALGNPCNFPPAIQQGDEFYFSIDTAKPKDCIVCMAYYPKPAKALAIMVHDK